MLRSSDPTIGMLGAALRRLAGPFAQALAGVLLALGVLALLPVSAAVRVWLSDSLQLLLALVATGFLGAAGRRSSGVARAFWLLMAASTLAWATGQALWELHGAAFSHDLIFPPWDFFFLGASVPLLIALLLRPDRRRSWSLGLTFDLVIFSVLLLHAFVYVGLGYAFAQDLPAYSRFAAQLNDIRGLGVPLLALWLLRDSNPPWRSTYGQIAAALTLWNVGDILSSQVLRRGLYEPGPLDLPWTLPFVWLALAARSGPVAHATESRALVPDWPATRRSTLLVVVAAAAIALVHLAQILAGSDPPGLVHQRSALTFGTLVLVAGLFLGRQLRLLSRLEEAARTEMETRVRLQRTERMGAVGMLVAGVAHEINNPLTAILGHAELLLRRPHEPLDPGQVEQIREAAERCARIVRNLLLFARDPGAEREVLNLTDLARRVAELEANELRVRGVRLQLELGEEVQVQGNAGQLQQVLVNLVTNALHAVAGKPGAGRLRLAVHADRDARAVVELEDDGPGIPPELREEVFKPLFTTKAAGEGTGLGLAISRDIVSSHAGTLTAGSGAWGGAVFRLELPLVQPSPPGATTVEVAVAADLSGLRVFVVDDEPSLREVVARILKDAGAEVAAAGDGETALRSLAFAPRVVVSDVRMPGMGGGRFYERCLQQEPRLRGRFVFITGDTASRETWEFLAESGCETLQKPFSGEVLVAAVARAARGGRS